MIKRTFDLFFSIAGLLVLWPALIVIAIIVKIDSTGPIFFRQVRIGRNGVPFRIHKFRTMRGAETAGGAEITIGADSRITRSGQFLRRYKLDELPQLIDVLVGNMSFVGPRPEVPKYVALYPGEVRDRVLSIRPGITDRSSIMFRDESSLLETVADPERYYIDTIIPTKLEYHLAYLDRMSLLEDVHILWRTIRSI